MGKPCKLRENNRPKCDYREGTDQFRTAVLTLVAALALGSKSSLWACLQADVLLPSNPSDWLRGTCFSLSHSLSQSVSELSLILCMPCKPDAVMYTRTPGRCCYLFLAMCFLILGRWTLSLSTTKVPICFSLQLPCLSCLFESINASFTCLGMGWASVPDRPIRHH